MATTTNEKLKYQYTYIMPFDVGYTFYDPIDCKDNDKANADNFSNTLRSRLGKNYVEIPNSRMRDCIIAYNISDRIKCFLMPNGSGVFAVVDNADLPDVSAKEYAIEVYDRRRKMHNIILKGERYDGIDVSFLEPMYAFMKEVWAVKDILLKSKKVGKHRVRCDSCHSGYKSKGISYVLTIYQFASRNDADGEFFKQAKYLLDDIDSNSVKNEAQLEKLKKRINSDKTEFSNDWIQDIVRSSWSGVACIGEFDSEANADLLRIEVDLQAKWFYADCLMDVAKNANLDLVQLQEVASILEYQIDELQNVISANMSTSIKRIHQDLIKTSSIIDNHKLSLSIIKNKIKKKEAEYKRQNLRNAFVSKIILSVFTAASVLKTIMDLKAKVFDAWDYVIMAGVLGVLFFTIFFENRRKQL